MDCFICRGHDEAVFDLLNKRILFKEVSIGIFKCGRTCHDYCVKEKAVDGKFRCGYCHEDHEVELFRRLTKNTPGEIERLIKFVGKLQAGIRAKKMVLKAFAGSYFTGLPEVAVTSTCDQEHVSDRCLNCLHTDHDTFECENGLFLRDRMIIIPVMDGTKVEFLDIAMCFQAKDPSASGRVLKSIINSYMDAIGNNLFTVSKHLMSRIINMTVASFFYKSMCHSCGSPFHEDPDCTWERLSCPDKQVLLVYHYYLAKMNKEKGDSQTIALMKTITGV